LARGDRVVLAENSHKLASHNTKFFFLLITNRNTFWFINKALLAFRTVKVFHSVGRSMLVRFKLIHIVSSRRGERLIFTFISIVHPARVPKFNKVFHFTPLWSQKSHRTSRSRSRAIRTPKRISGLLELIIILYTRMRAKDVKKRGCEPRENSQEIPISSFSPSLAPQRSSS
jgi:hypothetical protein